MRVFQSSFFVLAASSSWQDFEFKELKEILEEHVSDESIKVLDFPRVGDYELVPAAVNVVNSSYGVQITSDSWCGVGKKFPRLCGPDGNSCFLCSSDVPGYEIGEVLRPSSKFWASAIQKSQQNARASVEINLNAAYQLSGVYLQLGPGILPRTLSIELEGSEGDVKRVARVNFDGECTPTRATSDSEELCQNEPVRANGEVYVNFLSRRPGQFSLADSEELSEFINGKKLRLVFDGLLKNDYTTVNNAFYSLRRVAAFARCDCNGFSSECSWEDGRCGACSGGRFGARCQFCEGFLNPIAEGACPKCRCSGFSNQCVYNDEEGSVACVKCAGNREGESCERCKSGFHFAGGNALEECISCDCNEQGTIDGSCDSLGRCECRAGYTGEKCDVKVTTFEEEEHESSQDYCQDYVYECPASLILTDSCGKININPNFVRKIQKCSFIVDTGTSSSSLSSILLSVTNLQALENMGGFMSVTDLETGKFVPRWMISESSKATCSRRMKIQLTIPSEAVGLFIEFKWANSRHTDESRCVAIAPEENLKNQISDSKSSVQDFLSRSKNSLTRGEDQQELLSKITQNFIEKFEAIKEKYAAQLEPVQTVLSLVSSMSSTSPGQFTRSRKINDGMQAQIDSTLAKLRVQFQAANEVIQELDVEIEKVRSNIGEEIQQTKVEHLEKIALSITEKEKDFADLWALILEDAEVEALHSSELLQIVLDRFGKASEEGTCWFSDGNGVKTIDRYSESDFEFMPVEFQGSAGFSKAPLADRDFFPEIDWLDESDFDFEIEALEPRRKTNGDELFSMQFENGDTVEGDLNFIVDGFSAASGYCAKEGKTLAVIKNTANLNALVQKISGEDIKGPVFLGLKFGIYPVPWTWEARNVISAWKEGWANDQPAADPDRRCVAATATGWATQNCDTKLAHYVCLGPTENAKSYRYYVQSIVGGGMSYAQAVKGCREKKRVLAVVATQRQDKALLDVFKQNPKINSAWIGLKAKGGQTEEKWQWVDGTVTSDIKLSDDRAATNGCLAVKQVGGKMQIGLVNCDVRGSFLCSENIHHRERRHIEHRPDRAPVSIIHPAPIYREFFEGVTDDDFTDVIQYDWQWPRYGWLADQARCVEVIKETYLNLTDFIGSIDSSVQQAEIRAEIANDGLEHVLGEIENDEHISNAAQQWAEISENMEDAENALQTLKNYVEELTDADILLKDITPESFETLRNHYSLKLRELEVQWSCENIDFGELDIPNTGDDNLYEPLCLRFTHAMDAVRAKLASLENDFEIFKQSDCWADVGAVYCEEITPRSLGVVFGSEGSCDGVKVDLLSEEKQDYHCFIRDADFHIYKGAENVLAAEKALVNLRSDLNDPRFTGVEWTEAVREANLIGEEICSGKLQFTADRELQDFEETLVDLLPGTAQVPKQLSPEKAESDIESGVFVQAEEILKTRDEMQEALDFADKFDLDKNPDNLIDSMKEIIKNAQDEMLPTLANIDIPMMENLVNENENDNIVADFENYLKTEESFEEELKTLEHLIKSSRGLLSRLDDNLNSMSISGKQSVEIYDPPPFDGHHQFEIEFNLKIDDETNNILTLKDGDGSQLIVETRRGVLFAKFVEYDEAIVLSTDNPLVSNTWTRVKISSSGSALFLHFYVLNCDELPDNVDMDREDGGTASPCDRNANVDFAQLDHNSRHWHINSGHEEYEMTFGGSENGRVNSFAISNPLVNGLAVGLYDSYIHNVEENHDLVVDEPLIHTATCYNIFSDSLDDVDGFGKARNTAIDTCVCLDGDESYFEIGASNLRVIYFQRLQIQVDFMQNAPSQTALVTLMYNDELGSYLALEKFGSRFRFSFRANWDEDIVVVEDSAGAPTDDSYLRLYFGIYNRQGKFYAVVYAKADEDGKTNADIVAKEISASQWKILSDSLGESALIFGGHHANTPGWLEDELESFAAPERALAACLRLININDDSLNTEVYNTIDGVGIHRHRDATDRRNIYLETGEQMDFEIERFNKNDQLAFSFHSENARGTVAQFGPVRLSIKSGFFDVSGCSSQKKSPFRVTENMEHATLIRRVSRSETVIEISRSDGANEEFRVECRNNEAYRSLSFGGDGFQGIIARPFVFNEQRIVTDILNELRCREPSECAHLEFNKDTSAF